MSDGIITTKKMNQILEANEDIAMAAQVLLSISRDKAERARLMSKYKFETDHQSKIVQAVRKARTEGEAIGENRIIELLKSGKSMEEILKMYDTN